jgi:4-hydroxy-tetrahydrodipicolinate synthase
MANKLGGTGVALITPFTKKGTVDYKSLEKLIDHVIAKGKGVDFIVSLGTTGETATLSSEEKKDVWAATKSLVNGRVPLVAGIGGNDTHKIAEEISKFDHKGFDAILSVSPYYNKPTQEGIFQYYKRISDASKLQVIVYNVPGRTSSNIKAATTLRMAHELKNILGVKEASGDLMQCMDIIHDAPKNFLVLSGDDALTLPLIAGGMSGVISVIANAFPVEFSSMVRHALKGDMDKARKIHYALLPFNNPLYAEGNPTGVKTCMELQGLCGGTLREPLLPGSADLQKQFKAALKKMR